MAHAAGGHARRMRPSRSAALIASIPLAVGVVGVGGSALAAGGESDKAPADVIADVKRDLAKVKSFHVVITDKAEPGTTISFDILASGSARMLIHEHATTVRVAVVGKTSYLKGDAAYWRAAVKGATGRKVAKQLAGRWVKVPEGESSFSGLITEFSPKRLASCVDSGLGTLAVKGTQEVGGQDAVVIEDKGDKPGTAPGLLYVTADGPILPLKAVQTGGEKPGGKVDKACDDTGTDDSNSKSRTTITFSRYNKIDPVRAPHGAITLPDSYDSGAGGADGSTPI
jgi:hypothetical protein